MQIISAKVIVTCPGRNFVTLKIETDQGVYAIGEAVDVTGWLGGYNFQWAWASSWAAGQVV